jgi:hypothetical protein
LHSRGLVAGRYQPLADGDTLMLRRPTMPCFLQSRQKAKRNELEMLRVPLRFDLGSKRPSRRDGLVPLLQQIVGLRPRFASI